MVDKPTRLGGYRDFRTPKQRMENVTYMSVQMVHYLAELINKRYPFLKVHELENLDARYLDPMIEYVREQLKLAGMTLPEDDK